MNKRNLTIREAAIFLCCSPATIRRLIDDAEIPAFHLRGRLRGGLRIPVESLIDLEKRHAQEKAESNGNILFQP